MVAIGARGAYRGCIKASVCARSTVPDHFERGNFQIGLLPKEVARRDASIDRSRGFLDAEGFFRCARLSFSIRSNRDEFEDFSRRIKKIFFFLIAFRKESEKILFVRFISWWLIDVVFVRSMIKSRSIRMGAVDKGKLVR